MWTVLIAPEFEDEIAALEPAVRIELLAQAGVIERLGPLGGRPRIDSLKGSRHANMKELRFDAADGVWRVAFAFDPGRRAVLLFCCRQGERAPGLHVDARRGCGPGIPG